MKPEAPAKTLSVLRWRFRLQCNQDARQSRAEVHSHAEPGNEKLFLVLFFLLVFTLAGCSGTAEESQVTVYCALDREFSEPILKDFTRLNKIMALPKYDTEANKSVSLYQDLVREAEKPRCDVHWNNEILATIRLQKKGILQPYESPSAKSYPSDCAADDHSWHAFAARARILLVNTKLVAKKDWPKSLLDLTKPRFRNKVAMAKPQFGTTATQAACLFQVWGSAKTKKFYRELKANGVQIVPGNKQVAVGVGEGRFVVGMTDTDDAMAEVRAGRLVQIIFPDQEKEGDYSTGALFIPNTVALIRNCRHPEAGKKLIDYLLTPEVEAKLAKTESCQIPLNPNVDVTLPEQMQPARTARHMRVDFHKAAGLWDEAQQFLAEEFAR